MTEPRKPSRDVGESVLRVVALLVALVALAFVAHAFFRAPPTPVASEIGYEAYRVARHLPLYVDPWKGAWEDGAPPARFFVLYTPLFPWFVGKLASPSLAAVRVVGRTIALLSWLAVLGVPVLVARPGRRRHAAYAAMLGAGIYFVARHAASMSPDTLAAALVCIGVLRAAKKDGVDPLAAMLLVAAPLVKPSCLGGVGGIALVHFALRRPGWVRSTAAGLFVALLLVGASHVASDGAWLSNISRSTGQPLTLTRWGKEFGARAMLLGVPHLVVLLLAYRRRLSWFVVGALAGSIGWTTFIMAKHGSGAHYWLEPTGLAVVAVSVWPAEPARRPLAWVGAAFGVLVAIVSWPKFLALPQRYAAYAETQARVRDHCVHAPGEFVASTDVEMELYLNGRISVPAWQSAFLARSGKFPADAWREDLARPEVRWLVLLHDPRRPPGRSNDEQVELSPVYDILKDVILDRFEFDRELGGYAIFRRK